MSQADSLTTDYASDWLYDLTECADDDEDPSTVARIDRFLTLVREFTDLPFEPGPLDLANVVLFSAAADAGYRAIVLSALCGGVGAVAKAAVRGDPAACRQLVDLCVDAGPAVDAAIALFIGGMASSTVGGAAPDFAPPRLEAFYPALLLDEVVSVLRGELPAKGRSQPLALVRVAVGNQRGLSAAARSLASVPSGLGAALRWPSGLEARAAHQFVSELESSWARAAEAMLAPGRDTSSSDRRVRSRAAQWCSRSSRTLQALATDPGWLSLWLVCLVQMRRGVARWLEGRRRPWSAADYAELTSVVRHDLAPCLALLADGLDALGAVTATDVLTTRAGDAIDRQRLHRSRHRVMTGYADLDVETLLGEPGDVEGLAEVYAALADGELPE